MKKYWKFILALIFFLIVVSTFPKHDEIYLYVPTGTYMKYLEYLVLFSLPFITWYFHKKYLQSFDKKGFRSYLILFPKLHYFLSLFLNILFGAFFLYTIGIFMDYMPQNYEYKTYKVKVKKVTLQAKRTCRPALKTDILDKIQIKNKTLFHSFVYKFEFDKICTYFSKSNQVISQGGEINVKVKESPWGIYVYEIP